MYAGQFDGRDRHDRALQFAFERAVKINLFSKVARAEVGLVEKLVSDPATFWNACRRQLEPQLSYFV